MHISLKRKGDTICMHHLKSIIKNIPSFFSLSTSLESKEQSEHVAKLYLFSCFHLNEQLKVINVSTFFVVPRIIGNILRAIKLSKYNMLIKESFTLPNMRGDRDEIYLWYAAISEFKFELITQHHIQQELKQTLITHFEDLKGFFLIS